MKRQWDKPPVVRASNPSEEIFVPMLISTVCSELKRDKI
jgi:hypothetical protein